MELPIKHVVNDQFSVFAQNEDVMTYSTFKELLTQGDIRLLRGEHFLGQGFSEIEIEQLKNILFEKKLTGQVSINFSGYAKLDKQFAHKHKLQNVMITMPVQIGKDVYRSHLSLDQRCAEMSDHITGHHLQGMVLTEAARQMMLAVSEIYYLNSHLRHNMYFILHSIQTEFMGFVFPVDTVLEHKVLDIVNKKNNTASVFVSTKFYQVGELKTEVLINYTMYEKEFMINKERAIAYQTLLDEKSRLFNTINKNTQSNTESEEINYNNSEITATSLLNQTYASGEAKTNC